MVLKQSGTAVEGVKTTKRVGHDDEGCPLEENAVWGKAQITWSRTRFPQLPSSNQGTPKRVFRTQKPDAITMRCDAVAFELQSAGQFVTSGSVHLLSCLQSVALLKMVQHNP